MPELHRAAYQGKLKEVKRLLQAGAIANEPFCTGLCEEKRGSRGTSPLAIAVWNGSLPVVKLLAQKMANTAVS